MFHKDTLQSVPLTQEEEEPGEEARRTRTNMYVLCVCVCVRYLFESRPMLNSGHVTLDP